MTSAPFATTATQSWLAKAVFGLDIWLRRWHMVFEYSSHPNCIFRLEITQLQHPAVLSDGTMLAAGASVAQLHLWSEQIPVFPSAGATLNWACRMNRHLDISLRELAFFLRRRPDLTEIRAVRAKMAFGTADQTHQLLRLCRRFGFEAADQVKDPRLGARLHRLGENILIAFMVLARNPKGFRFDCLRRDRVDVFLPRAMLESRYSEARAAPE